MLQRDRASVRVHLEGASVRDSLSPCRGNYGIHDTDNESARTLNSSVAVYVGIGGCARIHVHTG